MTKHSLCTLSLALAMSLSPGASFAASHCKGLTEDQCSPSKACKWHAAKVAAFGVSPRKAHCRLDVKAAGAIAAKITDGK